MSADLRVPVVVRFGRGAPRFVGGPPRSALFLDRDGVIIDDRGYIGRPDDVALLPGVAAAIRDANMAGVPVIVVSNQSGVGRGFFGWDAVDAVDDAMGAALSAQGAAVDLTLYCGVGPDDASGAVQQYRKPAPGMLLLAARILLLDLAGSVMVGDRPRDLEAAARAGLRAGLFVGPLIPADFAPGAFALSCEADAAAAIACALSILFIP